MIELRILQGPRRGSTVAHDRPAAVVRRPAEPAPTPVDADHTLGGWVVRPIAGGGDVRINGRPADGRTAVGPGDRIEAGGCEYEVVAAAPPRDGGVEQAEPQFVLRFDPSRSPTRHATLSVGSIAARAEVDAFEGDAEEAAIDGRDAVLLPLPKPLGRGTPWRLPHGADREPSLTRSAVVAAAMLAFMGIVSLLLFGVPPSGAAMDRHRVVAAPSQAVKPLDTAMSRPSAASNTHADPSAPDAAAAPGLMILLDASPAMAGRLPHAVDHLRGVVAGLDASRRFLVTVVERRGMSFVPAAGVVPAEPRTREEALAFFDHFAPAIGEAGEAQTTEADAGDPRGLPDRLHAIALAIAYAEPGDEVLLVTGRARGDAGAHPARHDAASLHDALRDLMAGCDLRLSVVQLYDDAPDPALRRIAEDFGGDHTPLHAPRVASVY